MQSRQSRILPLFFLLNDNIKTFTAYERSIDHYLALFRIKVHYKMI